MTSWEHDLDAVQREFLRHPTRRRIAELLARRPGLNKSQVARELGVHLNVARFHLRRLEAVDLVETRPSPREREVVCFLQRDVHLWDDPRTRVLFGGSPVAAVARHVAERPGATAREIAEATSLTPGAVHHHFRTLLRLRLVVRYRVGPEYRHFARDELKRWADATDC